MENNRKYPKKTEDIKQYYREYYARKKNEIKKVEVKPQETKIYHNCDLCKTSFLEKNLKQHQKSKKHIKFSV